MANLADNAQPTEVSTPLGPAPNNQVVARRLLERLKDALDADRVRDLVNLSVRHGLALQIRLKVNERGRIHTNIGLDDY